MHKQDNRIFENIRDASKFTFNIKFNEMTPCDIKKVNKTSLHKEIPKSQLEKLSKGTFKYIVRVYTLDMFEQHIKRLERAKSLFSQKELDQAKSSKIQIK